MRWRRRYKGNIQPLRFFGSGEEFFTLSRQAARAGLAVKKGGAYVTSQAGMTSPATPLPCGLLIAKPEQSFASSGSGMGIMTSTRCNSLMLPV